MRQLCSWSLAIAFIITLLFSAGNPAAAGAATIHHYEYVFTAGYIYVYDMDNNHALLKTVTVPTGGGVRGAVASVATGLLYISYGSDSNTGGFQLAYNLATDQVVWTTSYSHGIDSQSITPDGTTIYMPEGEDSSGNTWYVENSSNGADIATILAGGSGPHNTIVSPGTGLVYMGSRALTGAAGTDDFAIASTATNTIVGRVTPVQSGVRPFTINSQETLVFITLTGFLGFQVGDLAAGNVLYTVAVNGSNIPGFTTVTSATTPSHGISLSPDDKEIYLMDEANGYVHVFDVSGLPAGAPVQVADIKLVNSMAGNEAGCPYDCGRNGWLLHSRDGRFVYVGDAGDVIDTMSRTTIATLPQLANSREHIEIDFQDSTPIWAATSRSGIGYVNPLPPTFTTRFTSPNLGSTVSGASVAVTASVFTTGTLSALDLYVDGVLYGSVSASPYSFAWDTTKYANGVHTLMVTALDTVGNTTSFAANFTVSNVVVAPLSVATTTLAAGTQNVAYSAPLAATGGTPPYAWSILSGALPTGLMLAPATGIISGPPTGTGSSSFTVQVTDANSLTASAALSITINASGGGGGGGSSIALVQSNAALGSAVGSLSAAFPAGNTAGNLIIAFVRMSSTSQTVTVTDSAGDTFAQAVTQAQAADGHQVFIFFAKKIAGGANTVKASFSASNNHPWLAIYEYSGLSTTNPLDQTAHAQGTSAAASSGATPAMTVSANELLFAGTGLPSTYTGKATAGSGYTMLQQGTGTSPADNEAEIATSTGTYTAPFTLSASTNWSAVLATFAAVGAAPTPPSVTRTSVPSGTQNTFYSATLAASGGTTPYTWSILSGTLPAGLTLAPSTGIISGTPTGTGSSSFSVQVTDANSLKASQPLTLTVAANPPSVTTTSLSSGTQNAAYSATLAATGGTTPYAWSIISGSLPTGLTLTPATGIISGTPTGTGSSSFSVQVTDANSLKATQALTLTVTANPPSVTTTSLASGTQNSAYSATLAATGGTTPYTWSILSGTLPAGLTLAPSTGIISGTPTGTGASSFTVQVKDANSLTADKALSLMINASGGGGGASIALVQSNAAQGLAVSSVSAAFPASNTAGNLIIVFVRMSSTSQTVTVTDSVGDVFAQAVTQAQAADGHQVFIFYAKKVAGGANTVKASFSASNNHPWLAIYEYSGLSTTNPLDQTAHAQGTSAAASSGATAAITVSANELLFAGTGLPASYTGKATAGSGFMMLQQDTSTSPADNEAEVVNSTATYTAPFTLSPSANWSAVLATFKP